MGFQDFMNKVRYWDNYYARLMMRHFYLIFFEFVLVIIFFIWFFKSMGSIDLAVRVSQKSAIEQLVLQEVTNTQIIVILMLLNSFWMLYIFNGLNRLRIILRDISFNLSRRRQQGETRSDDNW